MDARYGRPNMSQRQGIPSTATSPGAPARFAYTDAAVNAARSPA
jgi:hypothetical protein